MNEEIKQNILKTGTVNVGIVCKDGIILASDKKVTLAGSSGVVYQAGKMKKIMEINDRLILSMAGTASDAVRNISVLSAEIRLKELKTRSELSVHEAANLTANMLFQNIRTPSMIPSIAHFLMAGYDETGEYLYDISPDGYLKHVQKYVSSGSGMMQADSILDSDYKAGLSVSEGAELAIKCIKAASGRDPGVGEGLEIYAIRKGKIEKIEDKIFATDLKDSK